MIAIVNVDVLSEIMRQLPAVGAIIVLVLIFIRYLETQQIVTREFFQTLHSQHLEARKQTDQRLEENSVALRENLTATVRNTGQISDLSRIIDRLDRNRP